MVQVRCCVAYTVCNLGLIYLPIKGGGGGGEKMLFEI
jgi:hypothetical protein